MNDYECKQQHFSVYKHTNKINGKVYIGMTSRPPEKRWKNGKGYSSGRFKEAINKYGWANFDHEIIAENLTVIQAGELEKKLINDYSSTETTKGYNEMCGGEVGGMYNRHHTEDAKEKIREARIRDGFTEEHKKHISESKKGAKHHFAKKVYQYSKDGSLIKVWNYMSQAANELHINKANIGETCHGKRKSAGGFVWKYEMR